MTIKRFNPFKIQVLLESRYIVTGFASESFVEIKEDVPRYKKLVDIDGNNIFTKSKNKGAEIRLTLKDNSDAVPFINEFIRAIDNNEVSGISILAMDLNESKDPRSYYGFNCKINIETTTKGIKMNEKTYVFIPETYYNEVSLMQPDTLDYYQAKNYILDSQLKVKA